MSFERGVTSIYMRMAHAGTWVSRQCVCLCVPSVRQVYKTHSRTHAQPKQNKQNNSKCLLRHAVTWWNEPQCFPTLSTLTSKHTLPPSPPPPTPPPSHTRHPLLEKQQHPILPLPPTPRCYQPLRRHVDALALFLSTLTYLAHQIDGRNMERVKYIYI